MTAIMSNGAISQPLKRGLALECRSNRPARASLVSPGNGHCLICFGPQDVPEPPIPELLAYEEEIRPEVEKRLGLGST